MLPKRKGFFILPFFVSFKLIQIMQYLLCDDASIRKNLLPLTFTRPVALLRVGITTLREKWNHFLGPDAGFYTEDYLSAKYGMRREMNQECLWINASFIPDKALAQAVGSLKAGQILMKEGRWVAFVYEALCRPDSEGHASDAASDKQDSCLFGSPLPGEAGKFSGDSVIEYSGECRQIRYPWDIFQENSRQISLDMEWLTEGRTSCRIGGAGLQCYGSHSLFAEEDVVVEHSLIDTTEGPVYLGKGSRIMPGCLVKGPLALCEGSLIKMGAKIYGGNTFGPYSKVAGEVENSVFIGYSNKAHDGFLGDAVLGEWCNLGAGTNCSNLKNDYTEVRVWNYAEERFIKTGLQFCGLIMGDHSKSAIGTQFNTGTVVGVAANVFAAGFPKNYIPSFSWGKETYRVERALETARIVYGRRGKVFAEEDARILKTIHEQTESNRVRFNTN